METGHSLRRKEEPGVDQKRWSASAMRADELAGLEGGGDDRMGPEAGERLYGDCSATMPAVEASLNRASWTIFSWAEVTENWKLLEN